jgi:hypothetical protein
MRRLAARWRYGTLFAVYIIYHVYVCRYISRKLGTERAGAAGDPRTQPPARTHARAVRPCIERASANRLHVFLLL